VRDNPEGGESDPAEGVCRRSKKNSPSVLSCIGKRTREGCDRGSRVGSSTADETGKGQFLRGKRRNLTEEGVVRKISFPKRVANVPNLMLRWWWCYPTPSEGWGREETTRRPKSRATPQGLDQRSKMEEVIPTS